MTKAEIQTFFRWLKENGIWGLWQYQRTRYLTIRKERNLPIRTLLDTPKDSAVTVSFIWGSTLQGESFWAVVSQCWQMYSCPKIYIYHPSAALVRKKYQPLCEKIIKNNIPPSDGRQRIYSW